MAQTRRTAGRGPFQSDQIRDGDRYELSNGHPIYCAPSGSHHAGGNVSGSLVLDTDPDVGWSGSDAGVSTEPGMLRAPDIVVRTTAPGGDGTWLTEAPPLAVEYAAQGQDMADLRRKIAELLRAGTRWVWVVRLVGLPRVEVHAAGAKMRTYTGDELLEAPGVLRNPVPARALFDRTAAHEATLRNLLQRHGYASLSEIRQEGHQEGLEKGIQEGRQKGQEEGQQQERLRIARSLLDVIADDRLLAAKTGLSEDEVRELRLTLTPEK